MVSNYRLTPAKLRSLKSRLTRAKNQKDWAKVKTVCEDAFETFEEHGYPDCWHLFNIARDDADYQLRRQAAGL